MCFSKLSIASLSLEFKSEVLSSMPSMDSQFCINFLMFFSIMSEDGVGFVRFSPSCTYQLFPGPWEGRATPRKLTGQSRPWGRDLTDNCILPVGKLTTRGRIDSSKNLRIHTHCLILAHSLLQPHIQPHIHSRKQKIFTGHPQNEVGQPTFKNNRTCTRIE